MKRLDGFLLFGLLASLQAGVLLYFLPRAEPAPESPVIFVGDSITHRLPVERVIEGGVNLGVESRTTGELLAAMPEMRLERAELVVLMIGTNDLRQHKDAGLESRFRQIGNRIPGWLLWNAIPPMPGYDVAPTNAMIERLCRERGQCTFVSVPWQRSDFQSDGVHPNARGNDKWISALRRLMPAPTV